VIGLVLALGDPELALGGPVLATGGPVLAPGGPDRAPGVPDIAPGGPDLAPGGPDLAPGGPDLVLGDPDLVLGGPGPIPGGVGLAPDQLETTITTDWIAVEIRLIIVLLITERIMRDFMIIVLRDIETVQLRTMRTGVRIIHRKVLIWWIKG